ncbi:SDR family oxidoreductase [Ascoidea rubescens DSM 1968]|uniref:Putative dihydrokaempferol 4-reductase n=1 Tax=Ascoidea rubescens DSM 1968 TaxID=1344418 RepID=A0A1D2VLK0_9ASCO|nr:putative dihydrokaempferol 4-reductase [Ascoidea rubescens DSM 1968]ODV62472.1 putative dihydrokaempferol 4-reductase [Ascoidea rubescens DSM 1968]
MAGTVLLTGASGYIALHILDHALKRGYSVIGTVRSTEKGEQILKNLHEKYPETKSFDLTFEIVEDIAVENAFDGVIKKRGPQLDYVLHTASPFSFGFTTTYEEALLKPAINGTANILKAVKEYAPNVKKVVITSSLAAVLDMDKLEDKSHVLTEKCWNPIEVDQIKDPMNAYRCSKKLAEKTVWKFVEEEKPSFKVTTVLPPLVIGPQLFDSDAKKPVLNVSANKVNVLLQSKYTPEYESYKTMSFLGTDVRDIAEVHMIALEKPETDGQRLLSIAGIYGDQLILDLINDNFPQAKGKIAVGDPSQTQAILNTGPTYDISVTLALTGIKFITLEQSIIDAAAQILKVKPEILNRD